MRRHAHAQPSLRSVIFWQWANQSLNVCVNNANANKSIEMSTEEIATGASLILLHCQDGML
jgi:hypothetical protein